MVRLNSTFAACLFSLIASGCTGSATPDLGAVSAPVTLAFARMTNWRPWQPAVKTQELDANPLPAAAPVPPPLASAPQSTGAVEARPLKHLRSARKVTSARVVTTPASPPAAKELGADGGLPRAVSCQTETKPGERVRMICAQTQ